MRGIVTGRPSSRGRRAANLRPGHAWLAGALPAGARRIRCAVPELAATLADAGAELGDDAPDVEIARARELRGDAPWALVSLSAAQPDGGARLVRAARRGAASAAVRAQAAAAARVARRRGYPLVSVLTWDLEQRLALPGRAPETDLRLAERLPQRAVVVARRSDEPALLDAIVAEVRDRHGVAIRTGWPLLRAGVLVVPDREAVLRVAVGPGRLQIERQLAALAALRAGSPPPTLADRIPWPLGGGRVGLGDWALEPWVDGRRPAALDDALLDECLDFLVALHGQGGDGERSSPAADAAFVADRLGDARTAGIRELGERFEAALEDVPRGFGHGDFWSGNLLVDGRGRLSGVIDWDAAGPGRLPLLDLLHLRLNADRPPAAEEWGPALVETLLPWGDSGPDALARAYLDRIGLDLGREQLHALVGAYWLDHVAHQLLYIDRDTRPAWLRNNVDHVLAALRDGTRPRTRSRSAPPAWPEDEWRDLAERSGSVFATPEWAAEWWRHFGRGREAHVEVHRAADGSPAALLPLYLYARRPLGVARFVGHGPADEGGPVCAPADVDATAAALRSAVADLGAHVLLAERLPAAAGWSRRLGGRVLAREESPVLPIAGRTWDEYLAASSSNFREQVRRRERKLAREHELRFRLADDPARLDADFDALLALHRARWGETEFGGVHAAFHRDFARVALERGWLRLWFLEVDGAARAAWYGLRFAGSDAYYQAGRDPAWDRASVGFVLLAHSIREAFADGMREYRFLRGGESYKYRFSPVEGLVETFAVGRGAVGPAAAAAAATLARSPGLSRVRRAVARRLAD